MYVRREIRMGGSEKPQEPAQARRTLIRNECCLVGLDRIDETGESRWHAIGAVTIEPAAAVVLLVVHAYREDWHGEEIIRIISARRAEKHEIRRYQEAAME
jgi:uncharacterized DUF497 family protein